MTSLNAVAAWVNSPARCGKRLAGVGGQLVGGAAGNRVEHAGLLQLAGDGAQPVSDRRSPITFGGIAFRCRSVLGRGELAGVEQFVVAATVGAHGAAGDVDGDDHRDRPAR